MVLSDKENLGVFQDSMLFLRSSEKSAALVWHQFGEFQNLNGLLPALKDSVSASLAEAYSLSQAQPTIRHLHLVEKEVLSADAYGLILDVLRFGMIQSNEIESIIEENAAKFPLPLASQVLEHAFAQRWFHKISNFKVH